MITLEDFSDYDEDYPRVFAPEEIHTYPEMNAEIKKILAMPPCNNPMNLYILARIEEMEAENEALKRRLLPEKPVDDALG